MFVAISVYDFWQSKDEYEVVIGGACCGNEKGNRAKNRGIKRIVSTVFCIWSYTQHNYETWELHKHMVFFQSSQRF